MGRGGNEGRSLIFFEGERPGKERKKRESRTD